MQYSIPNIFTAISCIFGSGVITSVITKALRSEIHDEISPLLSSKVDKDIHDEQLKSLNQRFDSQDEMLHVIISNMTKK